MSKPKQMRTVCLKESGETYDEDQCSGIDPRECSEGGRVPEVVCDEVPWRQRSHQGAE